MSAPITQYRFGLEPATVDEVRDLCRSVADGTAAIQACSVKREARTAEYLVTTVTVTLVERVGG